MHAIYSCFNCRALLALLLPLAGLWSGQVGASEWEQRIGSERPSSTHHMFAAHPLDDGGFVLSLLTGSLWYDAAGALQHVGPRIDLARESLGQHGHGLLVRAPALSFEPTPRLPPCTYQQLPDGWSARALEVYHGASDYATDHEGRFFVREFDERLFLVDVDCHVQPVPWSGTTIAAVATAADAPAAFVIGGSDSLPDRLQRIARDGTIEWTRSLPAPIEIALMRRLPGGDIVWTGRAGSHVHVQRVTPTGTVLWSLRHPVEGWLRFLDVLPGDWLALWTESSEGGGEVLVLDSSGRLRRRHDFGTWAAFPIPSEHALPVRALYDRAYPRQPGSRLVRIGEDGQLHELASLKEFEHALAETVSGTIVAAQFVEYGPRSLSVRLIEADGSDRPLPLPSQAMDVRTAGLDSDASAIAWAVEDAGGRVHLRLSAIDGTQLWDRMAHHGNEDDLADNFNARSAHLLPEHACVVTDRLSCWTRAEGEPVLVSEPLGSTVGTVVLTTSGEDLVVTYRRDTCSEGSGCRSELVSRRAPGFSALGPAEAGPRWPAQTSFSNLPLPDDNGSAWLMASQRVELLRLASDGQLAWRYSTDDLSITGGEGGADGRLLLLARDADWQASLIQVQDDGQEAWRVGFPFHPEHVEGAGDGWLLAGSDEAGPRLALVRAADGSIAWQLDQTIAQTVFPSYSLVSVTGDGRFAATRGEYDGQVVEWRSLADGTLLDIEVLKDVFSTHHFSATDGALVVAGSTLWPKRAVLRRVEADTTTEPLDATLDGAWYMPATSGQGLILRALPGTGQVYGGWFTFGTAAGEDRANLRWFTVHGTIEDDGSASMSILRNAGGEFAMGPTTEVEEVGSAHIVRTACDSARLEYAFAAEVNGGITGALPLQRLSGGGCIAATTPAELRDLLGAYYVQGTSGQGLLLVPSSVGVPRLDAAWFTYDPAGAADDAHAQHWFTLHSVGDVDAGQPIAFEIRRTIGGRFDLAGSDNSQVVGEATLHVQDCVSVRLSYAFDDSTLAGAYARLAGELSLQRVDPCGSVQR